MAVNQRRRKYVTEEGDTLNYASFILVNMPSRLLCTLALIKPTSDPLILERGSLSLELNVLTPLTTNRYVLSHFLQYNRLECACPDDQIILPSG